MKICLWFDCEAEEAVNYYTTIFQDSEIGQINRFGKEGIEFHGIPEGTVMAIDFSLNHMKFTALNGGPQFKFNEFISIIINCDTQSEIDHFWTKLSKGGEEGPCEWLKDKFGVSWQIVPAVLDEYLYGKNLNSKARVEKLAFQIKKFEIDKLKDAFEGK